MRRRSRSRSRSPHRHRRHHKQHRDDNWDRNEMKHRLDNIHHLRNEMAKPNASRHYAQRFHKCSEQEYIDRAEQRKSAKVTISVWMEDEPQTDNHSDDNDDAECTPQQQTPQSDDDSESSVSSSSSSSDSEYRRRKRKKRKRKRKKRKQRKEKKKRKRHRDSKKKKEEIEESKPKKETKTVWVPQNEEDSSSDNQSDAQAQNSDIDMIGPQLCDDMGTKMDRRDYGKAMLPGEADAIANFVQRGMRIPRRGEVGLTSEEIKAFEGTGFVMSGSRHKRMNAIRIRKENQIYSAEEARALTMVNFEEKLNREKKLMAQYQKLLNEKTKQ